MRAFSIHFLLLYHHFGALSRSFLSPCLPSLVPLAAAGHSNLHVFTTAVSLPEAEDSEEEKGRRRRKGRRTQINAGGGRSEMLKIPKRHAIHTIAPGALLQKHNHKSIFFFSFFSSFPLSCSLDHVHVRAMSSHRSVVTSKHAIQIRVFLCIAFKGNLLKTPDRFPSLARCPCVKMKRISSQQHGTPTIWKEEKKKKTAKQPVER